MKIKMDSDSDSELSDTQTQTPNVRKSQQSQEAKEVWGRLFSTTVRLKSIDLYNPSFVLGRSKDCDVVLDKTNFDFSLLNTISKTHFEISRSYTKHATFITDLSKNGTFVNGKLLGRGKRNVLQHDDQISLTLGSQVKKVYVYKTVQNNEQSYLPLELKKRYEISQLLGSGTFGEVRLLFEKETCREYAVKRILKEKMGDSNMSSSKKIDNEIEILKSLSHPCIISMKEVVETKEAVYIILEYMEGGELLNRINRGVTESVTKLIFYQLLDAVLYLHSNGVTHRDIKPANILLKSNDDEPLVKISDFGLSKMIDNSNLMSTMCGTPYFVAPEVIDKKCARYTAQVDVWSLGVLLFKMLCKKMPFWAESQSKLFGLILAGKYEFKETSWKNVSDEAKDVISKMLVLIPEDRIKVIEIFDHPWISNDEKVINKAKHLIIQEQINIEKAKRGRSFDDTKSESLEGVKRRRLN